MTLARGTRTIVVDGITYRWKVRGRPTYDQGLGDSPLRCVVELAEDPGALLVISMPWAHPSNWVGLPGEAVRPGLVAEAVREARALGWRPHEPGPAFPHAWRVKVTSA